MKDNINLPTKQLSGEITILRDGIIVFKEPNTIITANVKDIILNCLALPTSGESINQITFIGDFTTVVKGITNRVVDNSDGSVLFTANAYEADFNGTISELRLGMGGTVNKDLAVKTGLAVLKDYATEIEVQWKIKLNIT